MMVVVTRIVFQSLNGSVINYRPIMKPNPGPTTATSSRTKASSARCMVKLDVTTAGQACDKKRAISNQNFEEIRRRILSKRYQGILNGEDAFVDKLFPPDKGSLTYVYSGDDKYDRMSFRRPMVRMTNVLLPCYNLIYYTCILWGETGGGGPPFF